MGEDDGEQTEASRSPPAASVSQSDPGCRPHGTVSWREDSACGHRSAAPCAHLVASTALGAHLRPARPSPARGSPRDASPRVRAQ